MVEPGGNDQSHSVNMEKFLITAAISKYNKSNKMRNLAKGNI